MATTNKQMPIDRGWAWVIVIGHFFNLFFMVGFAKSIGILLHEFHVYFNIPMAVATMVMSCAAIIYAILSPFFVVIAEVFTARKVIMVAVVVAVFGMSLGSLLINIAFVIIFFGIGFGIGNSSFYGNGLVLIGQYFKERRSLASGLCLSGASIGQFVIPPLVQYLLETYSLSGTLLIMSGLYLHTFVSAALFRPPSFYKNKCNQEEEFIKNGEINGHADFPEEDDFRLTTERKLHALMSSTGSIYLQSTVNINELVEEKNTDEEGQSTLKSKIISTLKKTFDFSVLKNYTCLFYAVTGFLGFFGHFNFVLFIPAYALTRGIESYDKALLVSICGICDLVGRLSIGYVGDLKKFERYKMKSLCLICLGVNTFLFAFANNYAWIAVHSGLYGIFGGGYVCLLPTVLIDLIGLELMSRALALVLIMHGVGASLGQPLLGMVKDKTGNYDAVAYICGCSSVAAGIMLLFSSCVVRAERRRVKQLGKHVEERGEVIET